MFKGKENTIYDLMIGNNKKYAAKYTHKSVIKHRGMFFATQRGCFQNDTQIIVFFSLFILLQSIRTFAFLCKKKHIRSRYFLFDSKLNVLSNCCLYCCFQNVYEIKH